MATPQPPLTPDQRLALEQKERYDRLTRNIAIAGVVVCPIIVLLPPRKLDLYTLGLSIGFYLSADHLAQSYNGRPLYQQFSFSSPIPSSLPTEKARETSRILKEREEIERVRREGAKKPEERSVLQRVWMGDETEGWKERRMEEERKALEEGKTYTSIILDQIWEVWNRDKKNGDGEQTSPENEKPKSG